MFSKLVSKMDVKKVTIIMSSYLNGGSENFRSNILIITQNILK